MQAGWQYSCPIVVADKQRSLNVGRVSGAFANLPDAVLLIVPFVMHAVPGASNHFFHML